MKDNYRTYLAQYEKKNTRFTVLEALEMFTSFDLFEKVLPEIKTLLKEESMRVIKDSLVLHKQFASKFPNLNNGKDDIGLTRLGPFMPINPLKGSRANLSQFVPRDKLYVPKVRFITKYRRSNFL
jgi:hypothetical protein